MGPLVARRIAHSASDLQGPDCLGFEPRHRLYTKPNPVLRSEGFGGTVARQSTLRSAGTLLSRVRATPPAPWLDGGPESLRSHCC
ncbi:hypothetical protein PoB_001948400 [Plakobranchus ocellatus]|uniref:Uncharacterized protein n=1 Tax=Plakobranchus ocellatus TaxID=259542 RepID=A0AAV3ZGF4_9GAST|nr:hypothetical protein PoB_001948400 [Plakobranchus ocellatus]